MFVYSFILERLRSTVLEFLKLWVATAFGVAKKVKINFLDVLKINLFDFHRKIKGRFTVELFQQHF